MIFIIIYIILILIYKMVTCVATLSDCPTCTSALLYGSSVTISPLFRCTGCSAALSTNILDAGLGAVLAALRRDLRPNTATWEATTLFAGTKPIQGELRYCGVVAVCVAQVLVLASKNVPSASKVPLAPLTMLSRERMVDFAIGAFRNANMLVQRGRASPVGVRAVTLLAEVFSSWASVLPLLVVDHPGRVIVLLEAAARQIWQQLSAVGVDAAMRRVIGALVSVYTGLAMILSNNDGCCVNLSAYSSCSALKRLLKWQKEEHEAEEDNAVALAELRDVAADIQETSVGEKTTNVVVGEDEESKAADVFPFLRLQRDPLSVILAMLSPQRVLWGIGLVNRQLSCSCRDPLLWRLLFKGRWPEVKCIGHLDTDPHDWLRLYINRRALTHLAALKRKQQLSWLRNNKRGHKRLAPPLCPCNVCGCNKQRLYRKGEAMARHVLREHDAIINNSRAETLTIRDCKSAVLTFENEKKRRRVGMGVDVADS